MRVCARSAMIKRPGRWRAYSCALPPNGRRKGIFALILKGGKEMKKDEKTVNKKTRNGAHLSSSM